MGFWSKVGSLGKRAVNAPIERTKKMVGYESAKENFGWIGRLGRSLMPSSLKAGRVETFEHAMARQSVTDDDLDRIYTNHVLRFWICAIMLVTGLAVGLHYLMNGQKLIILPVIGFSAICLSQMFSGSFRAYQLANRKFCDVSEWMSRRDVWVPFTFDLPKAPARKTGGSVDKPRQAPPVKKD